MTIRELQEQLDKERSILKAAKDRIAIQNKELEELRKIAAGSADTGLNNDALEDANIRLTELVNNLNNGVFVVDEDRRVIILNDFFCKLFEIKQPAQDLIGMHGPELIKQIKGRFQDPARFLDDSEEIVKNRKAVLNDEIKMVNGQVFCRDFIPFVTEGKYRGHLWKFTDITRQKTIGETFDTQRKFYE